MNEQDEFFARRHAEREATFHPPKPRVYIAGPMTGLPEYNFPAFHAAAAAWRAAGWEVLNPAESFDGATNLPYKVYAAHDVQWIQSCQAIAMLPGWDGPNARGSVWERELAMLLGLEVLDAEFPVGADAYPVQGTPFQTANKAHIPQDIVTATLSALPTDKQLRKDTPICSGVLDYFPSALAEVARVSKAGNDQHNPGQPLHWARGKSMDHADCIVRHLMERGMRDTDGMRHTAKAAWRVLALLQQELEDEGAPMSRASKVV